MNNGVKGAPIYRAIMLFPHIASLVAVTVVWQFLYNAKSGPFDQILQTFGVDNPPAWLSNQKTALIAVMIMIVWKGIGYYMIIYLAGLRKSGGSVRGGYCGQEQTPGKNCAM